MSKRTHPVKCLEDHYRAASDELVLFVDESGDARLNDPSNRLFILAACVTIGGSMDASADKWREVRREITGNPDTPLHFADLSRRLKVITREQAITQFFDTADIGRIAVAISASGGTNLSSHQGSMIIHAAFDELLFQQAQLIRHGYTKLTFVFEDSKVMKRVYELCRELRLLRNDGLVVSVNFLWVTKAADAPWLEIADAMAHAFAGVVRSNSSDVRFVARSRAMFSPKNGAPAITRILLPNFSTTPAGAIRMTMSEQQASPVFEKQIRNE